MIVETRLVLFGVTVAVQFSRSRSGYSAELYFGGDDRAVIDAGTLPELKALVDASAHAAVLARRCGAAEPWACAAG